MNAGKVRETLWMAFDALRTNRLRSGLTILGIVIGVATVIIISSIITGLNNKVAAFANSFGTNAIFVYHLPFGVQITGDLLARKRLTVEEATAMQTLPHVAAVAPVLRYTEANFNIGQESVKYRGKAIQNTILEGVTDQLLATTDIPLNRGSFVTRGQDERRANVVVLGHDTAEKLFGDTSPVGKDVEIKGEVFTVIGTLGKRQALFGSGANPDDNTAYLPLNTFRKLEPGVKDVFIQVRYDDPQNKALVEDEIRTLLRVARHVPTNKDDDFNVSSPDIVLQFWSQLTGGLVLFMIAVSSVGLMVGGVGVMNIMLVSVTERTREIGVRKAIGATRNGILLQFTVEAVTLCALGGALGVGIGGLVTLAIRTAVAALPASMSTLWVTVSFCVSCGIGLVFGIYPAWKAATLNPIDALRYE